MAVASVLTEAGDGRHDDSGVDLLAGLIVKAHLFHRARAEVLNDNVGLGNQLAEQLLALVGTEVDGNALLVAVEGGDIDADAVLVRTETSAVFADTDALDLDDLSAHVCQQHAAERSGDESAEVQNPDTLQNTFHVFPSKLNHE